MFSIFKQQHKGEGKKMFDILKQQQGRKDRRTKGWLDRLMDRQIFPYHAYCVHVNVITYRVARWTESFLLNSYTQSLRIVAFVVLNSANIRFVSQLCLLSMVTSQLQELTPPSL